jgi:hypothetical protein
MHGAPFDFCWGRGFKITPDFFWFLVNIFHSVPALGQPFVLIEPNYDGVTLQ